MDSHGTTHTTTEGIRDSVHDFYSDLYGPKVSDNATGNFFMQHLQLSLSEEDKEVLEGDLVLADLKRAILSLPKGRSPGSDGIPVELYATFWDLVGSDLLEVFRCSMREGLLPNSLRGGCIRLIYKKKGDRADVKNWRPISLLNVDFKILSKTLFLRLRPVVSTVVESDQTCGIPGRKISDNLCFVRDVLSYVKDRGLSLCLLNLDQEKAFDRLNHSFMFQVLKH
ncbi:hypothetical protein NDU88_000823 [Pleurodeles waltl]|uniref:Reverse transcriptase domain-containing protein n=1 Tax=Pleurodeles waltl TaxID=8319 RepID=A0AAV7KRU1_PLEWA|nr:hypothetical protein NDU88_000823 [Pleurodeles waltl]